MRSAVAGLESQTTAVETASWKQRVAVNVCWVPPSQQQDQCADADDEL